MKDKTPNLPTKILERVRGTQLYYPHSASDLIVPIQLFAPFVSDFWFVDLAYFRSDMPADKAEPVLKKQQEYLLLDVKVEGPPCAEIETRLDRSKDPPSGYSYIEPCIRTELYRHVRSRETFAVHRRRGYSVSGFGKVVSNLGVFFYRGDSREGSNIPWLTVHGWHKRHRRKYRKRVEESFLFRVLNSLINGGLLVTDGSRCRGKHAPYKEFRSFLGKDDVGAEAVDLVRPFHDDEYGRNFCCVGYAGQRYGPTLVWQVTKTESAS
jgi:hypothetical protein